MTVPDDDSKTLHVSSPQSWSDWVAAHDGDAPLVVGSIIRDRFVLEELIGAGGMGQVFRALDRRREEAQDRHPHVAIKVLAGDFKRHPDALRTLQREARKAQKLAHPNICSVYDFDRDGADVYLVMELLEGEPLNQLIKSHAGASIGLERALGLIEELGIALAHAHSKGIIHSDFKPSNVFLTRTGDVKIIDFGIARAARSGPVPEDVTQTVFDAGKLGAATLAYASPEQLLGVGEPDPRDDIYSLAVVAYELLAGRHPFGRRSALEAQLQEIKVAPVPGLSDEQNATLGRGLAFKREHRPATVNDFVVGLGLEPVLRTMVASHASRASDQATRMAVAGSASAGAPPSGASAPSPQAPRRSRSLAPVAIGLAAVLLLGGSYYAWQTAQQREAQQRQAEEQQQRAAAERIAEEQRAREAAEQARLAAEARAAAEAEARAQADRGRLDAEAQAERERLARQRSESGRATERRAEARKEKTDPPPVEPPPAPATAAVAPAPATPKPGTLYRWEDAAGEVHYGTQVPPQYADKAVPLVSPD